MYIYKITNTINGKVYIGQTVKSSASYRWANHVYDFRKGIHFNPHFQKAWNKYGEKSFVFEVIDRVAFAWALDNLEKFWIKLYNATNPDYGYNLSDGGQSNRLISIETRKKLSEAMRGNKHSLGRKPSGEEIERGAAKRRGRKTGPRPDWVKKKLSDALKGPKSLHWGKPGMNRRKVLCTNTGRIYESAVMAAKDTLCDRSTICRICRQGHGQIKGYSFKYVD